MARNLNSFNPFKVYPKRNLLKDSEPWGREIEDDVIVLKKKMATIEQFMSGGNRNTAASLASLSDQLNAISDTQSDLADTVSDLSDAQDDISDLLADQLAVNVYGSSGTSSNITSTSAATVRTASITIPSGYTEANVIAMATFSGNASSSTVWGVLETRINGTDYGYDQTSSVSSAGGRISGSTMGTATVTSSSFDVSLRARTTLSGTISGVYSNLRVMVIFTK